MSELFRSDDSMIPVVRATIPGAKAEKTFSPYPSGRHYSLIGHERRGDFVVDGVNPTTPHSSHLPTAVGLPSSTMKFATRAERYGRCWLSDEIMSVLKIARDLSKTDC